MMSVTIYHNPDCGTSRNTLAMIRQSGEGPEVIEYLKNPPSRARLIELIKAMGISVRAVARERHTVRRTRASRSKMERRSIDRLHAGAPDPDQPADRRNTEGHETVPAFGISARSA
jgi:arsenate reductase (glutaredoxin)